MTKVRGQFWTCGPKKRVGSRGRAELLAGTLALLVVHKDAESRFEGFALGNCCFNEKRGRGEEGAGLSRPESNWIFAVCVHSRREGWYELFTRLQRCPVLLESGKGLIQSILWPLMILRLLFLGTFAKSVKMSYSKELRAVSC